MVSNKAMIGQLSDIVNANYPETVKAIVLVNANRTFKTIYHLGTAFAANVISGTASERRLHEV